MFVVHKAIVPKQDYCDPTLCIAFAHARQIWWDISMRAHKASRVRWDKVTCKRCLKKRIKT